MNDDEIKKRLLASYEEYRKSEEEAGRGAGRNWAAKDASYAELKSLKTKPAVLSQWQVDRTPFEDYGDADDFWEQATDLETMPSEEYVEGFVKGALNVWSKVGF